MPYIKGINESSHEKRATSWENLFLPHANNTGADQPGHPRSLISAFVVHCFDGIISILAISKISRLWPVFVAEQAGLSLTWWQTPKTGFLVTRLKSYLSIVWFVNPSNVHAQKKGQEIWLLSESSFSSLYGMSEEWRFWLDCADA